MHVTARAVDAGADGGAVALPMLPDDDGSRCERFLVRTVRRAVVGNDDLTRDVRSFEGGEGRFDARRDAVPFVEARIDDRDVDTRVVGHQNCNPNTVVYATPYALIAMDAMSSGRYPFARSSFSARKINADRNGTASSR